MAVTCDTRPIWRTSLEPDFEGTSEAHARARDRMLAARAFVLADVQQHRRFREKNAGEAEVDRLLAFLERYELQREPFECAGDADPHEPLEHAADTDPDESVLAGGQAFP